MIKGIPNAILSSKPHYNQRFGSIDMTSLNFKQDKT